jgi:hypothetical protein
MAFWSKWLGSSPDTQVGADKTLEYNGYLIEARPYKDGGQWQLAGRISKDGKVHDFVRADKFSSKDEAVDIALSKARLIVDQSGDRMFT